MSNIPCEQDFERADRLDKERSKNLDRVRDNVVRRFNKKCPLHDFHILWQKDVNFRAYVFFKEDKDIVACESTGITQELMDAVYEELEHAGRGKMGDVTVAFEFDSDEHVTQAFEGNYFLRLL